MEDDGSQGEGHKIRRLRQKDLQELHDRVYNGEDKPTTIWVRSGPGEPLSQFMDSFPHSALAIFSPVWRKELEANANALVLKGPYLGVFKMIINWIALCIQEGNDVKFPEIEDIETEQDESPLHTLLQIIAAANYLQIPEGSLQAGLKKRGPSYARKYLIDLEMVERIYNEENDGDFTDDLREVAAISIFEGWWSKKLDAPEYDQYMSWLEQMRTEYPQLDADLHEQFERKKEFIRTRLAERRRDRGGAGAARSSGRFGHSGDRTGADVQALGGGSGDDGWGQAAAVVDAEGGGATGYGTEAFGNLAGA